MFAIVLEVFQCSLHFFYICYLLNLFTFMIEDLEVPTYKMEFLQEEWSRFSQRQIQDSAGIKTQSSSPLY